MFLPVGHLLAPQPVTTFVNSTRKVLFECVGAENGSPYWLINNTGASYYVRWGVEIKKRVNWTNGEGQRGKLAQMLVPTSQTFNASSIACKVLFDSGWHDPPPVLLLLQGKRRTGSHW